MARGGGRGGEREREIEDVWEVWWRQVATYDMLR